MLCELEFEILLRIGHTLQRLDGNPKLAIAKGADRNRGRGSNPLQDPESAFRHGMILRPLEELAHRFFDL